VAKSFLVRAVFLFLLLPAVVSGALLDDYYLTKFGADAQRPKAVTAVVPGEVIPAERCRTQLYRSLKRDWNLLEPTTKRTLAKYVSRPFLANKATFLSPGGHFTIHYATTPVPAVTGSDAPDLTDADSDGVPDWIEKVAAVFDHVYNVEVTEMQYRQPPGSRYDVYLRDLVSERAFGFTTDDGAPPFPATSVVSYIEIDRAFTNPIFTETPSRTYTPEQVLQLTAAHEFHHAIQFGYNYYFDFWYAEVTATWMEDELYDSVNQLYDYLPSYLPKTSTLSLNAPLGDNSEYGRWIFNRYLAERHSPSLIRDIWVKLGTMPATADGSDIPMLPVIDTVIKANASTLAADFTGFAKRLYLRNWATHTSDIGLIPIVAPQATFTTSTVDVSQISAKIASLPKFAFAYYKFLPGIMAPADLTLTLLNVPAGVEIVAIKKGTNGTIQEYALQRASGTITVPSFNTTGTSEVQLIICNITSDPAPAAVTPVASSAGNTGGGCFIATAAYGSYLHPKVAGLRHFRDDHLLTNAPGRLFVSLYYRLSPPVARVIGEHEWMRVAARGLLVPLVLTVEHPGGALALLLLSGGGVLWRLKRRRLGMHLAPVSSKGAA